MVFRPRFHKLDSNVDFEVSTEELELLLRRYNDEFSAKYWHIFDKDYSGTLNFEEYKYTIAAFADGVARLYIKARTNCDEFHLFFNSHPTSWPLSGQRGLKSTSLVQNILGSKKIPQRTPPKI